MVRARSSRCKGERQQRPRLVRVYEVCTTTFSLSSKEFWPGGLFVSSTDAAYSHQKRGAVRVDDVGKAYLQRKLLCTAGEVSGRRSLPSRTGVRAMSKMSTTDECTFIDSDGYSLRKSLEEELESENSYLLRKLLPSADAEVLAFDATELDEMALSQDDGEETDTDTWELLAPL